jgi:hypothetical protein
MRFACGLQKQSVLRFCNGPARTWQGIGIHGYGIDTPANQLRREFRVNGWCLSAYGNCDAEPVAKFDYLMDRLENRRIALIK